MKKLKHISKRAKAIKTYLKMSKGEQRLAKNYFHNKAKIAQSVALNH